MRGRIAVGLLVCLGGTAAVAAEADRFANVQVRATHVAGTVYMLEGRGGNIGASVGSDGVLIVDDQFAPLADKIRAALAKLGKGELEFVLNTHWHGDHTGGNEAFGPEATILAHDNVRRRLAVRQELRGRTFEAQPPEALPVITFDESLTVHFNGEEIRMLHLPHSHTDGDSVVFFTKSKVVHMGDAFFAGKFPFVDLDSGGDVEGLIRNLQKLIEGLPRDVRFIPGHGPVSGYGDLATYLDMLLQTTEIVRKRMEQGMTLEQIQELGLPEKWAEWGTGFIDTPTWLANVHRSLSGD